MSENTGEGKRIGTRVPGLIGSWMSRRRFLTAAAGAVALLPFLELREPTPRAPEASKPPKRKPFVVAEQGSFMAGGTVITSPGSFDPTTFLVPDGQTLHGDHLYVQFQIPPAARDLPLVMWHGGGQFSKTWESTPDGRDGYQTIFLRRGFAVYILDQARRGRAGQGTEGTTITPTTLEQSLFMIFRLGVWPNFFPNAQFPPDPVALDQYFRQVTPNTGPEDRQVVTNAGAALFDKIGPAVLLTHSNSGQYGWLTAIESPNVKAIISYEPVQFAFPEGEVPPPIGGPIPLPPIPVSSADFAKLTRIPIQIIYGDNIPTSPSPYPALDFWRAVTAMAAQFRDAVNRHGGDVTILNLPEVGVFGNTHFAFSDLNNVQIADLLSRFLHERGLDKRNGKSDGD